MRKSVGKAIVVLVSLAIVVVSFSACAKTEPTKVQEGPTAVAKTDWATWQNVVSEMETFNFFYTQNAKEIDVLSNCFDGLTTNDKYGSLIPCIAERWETPDGGKTWSFHLRKGVPWVDYKGEKKAEVVAEDFLWGLEWVLNYAKNDAINTSMPNQLIRGAKEYYNYTKELGDEAKSLDLTKFKEMVGVEAPDDYTLKFECLDKFPYFVTVTVYNCMAPVSGELLAELGVDGFRAVKYDELWYNGPYTITTYVQNNEKVLSKNPLYWDTSAKLFDTVTIKMVESADVAFQMFQNGEIDAITLTEANLQTIYRDPDHKYHKNLVEARPTKYSYQIHICYDKRLPDGEPDVSWNTAIANEAFRLSLYHGIDWTDYLARTNAINPLKCTNLTYSAANLVTTSDGRDYTDLVKDRIGMSPSLEKYARYDADKGAALKEQAIRELTAKGVTFPVECDYYIAAGNQTALDSATVLKNVIEEHLGEDYIKLNIKTYISSYAKEVRDPQLHSLSISGWGADFGDPINFLGQEIVNDDNAYYTEYYSKANNITDPDFKAVYEEFTRLVNEANAITDDFDARYNAFADAEAYMLDHALVIPIYLNIPWQLTHMNAYSAIDCAYGNQSARYVNRETSTELYTTEQYEEFRRAYEAGKGGK
jgi:oligopeptide transport system substrate-binding protein